jgi:hypothetical protein
MSHQSSRGPREANARADLLLLLLVNSLQLTLIIPATSRKPEQMCRHAAMGLGSPFWIGIDGKYWITEGETRTKEVADHEIPTTSDLADYEAPCGYQW